MGFWNAYKCALISFDTLRAPELWYVIGVSVMSSVVRLFVCLLLLLNNCVAHMVNLSVRVR